MQLSRACWERGQRLPSLALKKLFEKPGEAYHDWNGSLPGYVAAHPDLFGGHRPPLQRAFENADELRETYQNAQAVRECLRAEMIALQEEMDWLVYAAYGLLPEDHPAVAAVSPPPNPSSPAPLPRGEGGPAEAGAGGGNVFPLDREQRPFHLWAQAEGDYARAVAALYERRPDSPVTDRRYSHIADWPDWRKKLWEARLAAIRDNEHIRRIEQPVYKRRWDEQWKCGNQWRCGPVAYAAEFVDAFEWWMREEAEWWLELKKDGGPVELDEWALALWKDPRVQAAWPVAAENYAFLDFEKARERAEEEGAEPPKPSKPATDYTAFRRAFKRVVDEETVPEGIPWAIPYDDLEKKLKKSIPGKVRKIRGKLNVPRERFHLRGKSTYLWAGSDFR